MSYQYISIAGDNGVAGEFDGKFEDGSESLPSITFKNNNDTGLYNDTASGGLGITVDGSDKLTITPTSTLIQPEVKVSSNGSDELLRVYKAGATNLLNSSAQFNRFIGTANATFPTLTFENSINPKSGIRGFVSGDDADSISLIHNNTIAASTKQTGVKVTNGLWVSDECLINRPTSKTIAISVQNASNVMTEQIRIDKDVTEIKNRLAYGGAQPQLTHLSTANFKIQSDNAGVLTDEVVVDPTINNRIELKRNVFIQPDGTNTRFLCTNTYTEQTGNILMKTTGNVKTMDVLSGRTEIFNDLWVRPTGAGNTIALEVADTEIDVRSVLSVLPDGTNERLRVTDTVTEIKTNEVVIGDNTGGTSGVAELVFATDASTTKTGLRGNQGGQGFFTIADGVDTAFFGSAATDIYRPIYVANSGTNQQKGLALSLNNNTGYQFSSTASVGTPQIKNNNVIVMEALSNQAKFLAGSVTVPSITFDDADTGIYSGAGSAVGVTKDGLEKCLWGINRMIVSNCGFRRALIEITQTTGAYALPINISHINFRATLTGNINITLPNDAGSVGQTWHITCSEMVHGAFDLFLDASTNIYINNSNSTDVSLKNKHYCLLSMYRNDGTSSYYSCMIY